jgi:release factor glutamine methyltransferase
MTLLDSGRQHDVGAVRRLAADLLRKDGIESAELDARLLIGHALALDHAGLAAAQLRILSGDEIGRIAALITRRLHREPVARIVGQKEFWGLPLRLSPETLVPRPETEIVVEAALTALRASDSRRKSLRVVDLGTGSGALLLALLSELPTAFGIATDLSVAALATAHDNALHLGLAGRCAFVACQFGDALTGGFDLVVSNPPYVATAGIASLPAEVRDHDPHLALDGGRDGLDAYRRIAADAARLLPPDGWLVLEIGAGQANMVAAIMRAAGMVNDSPPRPDLAGIDRALTFRLRS